MICKMGHNDFVHFYRYKSTAISLIIVLQVKVAEKQVCTFAIHLTHLLTHFPVIGKTSIPATWCSIRAQRFNKFNVTSTEEKKRSLTIFIQSNLITITRARDAEDRCKRNCITPRKLAASFGASEKAQNEYVTNYSQTNYGPTRCYAHARLPRRSINESAWHGARERHIHSGEGY